MGDDNTPGLDRRTVLRRGAALGGALVWATPVVQTLGTGVAAAATPVILGCPDRNGSPPTSLTFTWTGDPCSASDGEALVSSTISAGGAGDIPGPVRIRATYGPGANATVVEWTSVTADAPIIIGGGGNHNTLINAGSGQLNPEVTFEVWVAGAGGAHLRTVVIHTSCSAPLFTNDTFCGFTLINGVFP